ncbi:hypothetical protein QJS10_CPA02g00941 [Acorus calamus]|uniref:Transducin/WD40 repeat-like superfamily protein n=1 Tax=Acorus calamus TaxID=4465 RepID=A0AAV9FC61_ACOCL|nr:hypothetical protein QJS10_CPA02g00941 [Acorus calamus]
MVRSPMVLEFDHSVEQFFAAMDTVGTLCGRSEDEGFDEAEAVERFSSIVFLLEWKQFCYEPKIVRFTYETESPQVKESVEGVSLPQFSSMAVPKVDESLDDSDFSNRKDFVLNAGGSVWALDWCPRISQGLDRHIKCEYLAVSAHPPGSTYHKLGAPLIGRGIVQIWCLLTVDENDELSQLNYRGKQSIDGQNGEAPPKRRRGRPRLPTRESTDTPKRPRGRPRKTPVQGESLHDINPTRESIALLDAQSTDNHNAMLQIGDLDKGSVLLNSDGSLSVAAKEVSVKHPADLTSEASPPPKRRGRPRTKPVQIKFVKDLNPCTQTVPAEAAQSVEDMSVLSSGSDLRTNPENMMLQINYADEGLGKEVVEKHSDDAEVPVRRSGRLRKRPVGLNPSNKIVPTVVTHIAEDVSGLLLTVKLLDITLKIRCYKSLWIMKAVEVQGVYPDDLNAHTPALCKRRGRLRKSNAQSTSVDNLDSSSKIVHARLEEPMPGFSSSSGCLKSKLENAMLQNCDASEGPAQLNGLNVHVSSPSKHMGKPRRKSIQSESLDNLNHVIQIEPASDGRGLQQMISSDIKSLDFVSSISENIPAAETQLTEDTSTSSSVYCCVGIIHENAMPLSSDIMNVSAMHEQDNHGLKEMAGSQQEVRYGTLESGTSSSLLQKDIACPRVVLCLAHNGKVAWDLKWRPLNYSSSECKYTMGYLAILLGSGCLEVWEVPLPKTVKVLYTSRFKDGIDPRFLKLEPVFKCTKVKCGGRQSIPLVIEWSPSAPHDLILAGCHDGTVALWKFSTLGASQDTRPLLCFTADTAPIRSVGWAPDESDPESANLIATAGHSGLKFWDLRCLLVAFDDGSLRILSLRRAANDVAVTGEPFDGTQQQGLHSLVAYCTSDGFTLQFQVVYLNLFTDLHAHVNQLTTKAVEKDPQRNRAPHFVCGSLTENDGNLALSTPLPGMPFPMQPSLSKWEDASSNQGRKIKNQVTDSLCGDDEAPSPLQELEDSSQNHDKNAGPRMKTGQEKNCDTDRGRAQANLVGEGGEKDGACDTENNFLRFRVFPPKMAAMHKVRWNMNKGSERWLCYGGAAGLIRCQKIQSPSLLKHTGGKCKQP